MISHKFQPIRDSEGQPISEMDLRRAPEVAGEDEDSYTREDDSIPLADGDPADHVEDSCMSEDRRKVGSKSRSKSRSSGGSRSRRLLQEFAWRKKVDFESLDSIPSMLSDRSDLGYHQGSGHIGDHMNRYVVRRMRRFITLQNVPGP